MTKPIGPDELLARIRAALRRAAPQPDNPTIATADFGGLRDVAASARQGPVAHIPYSILG